MSDLHIFPDKVDLACHLLAARIRAEPGRWYLFSATTADMQSFVTRFKELYPEMVVENPGAANSEAR